MRLGRWRTSLPALAVAALGWAGCATAPRPMVDPGYGARAYTPARVAILPPDVFVVVDQVGDNDPAQSAALGEQVGAGVVRAAEQALRARGYDVDLSARWDGIAGPDGAPLVGRDELGALANGIVSFANSREGGAAGAMPRPLLITPELAARVGWATQSDALLYVNVKGAVTTSGKRAASIVAGVFILVIVVAVVLALASQKGGGGGGGPAPVVGSGSRQSFGRAAPAGGSWRGAPSAGAAGGANAWRGAPPAAGGPAGNLWRATPAPTGALAPSAWRAAPGNPTARPLAAPTASAGVWRGGGAPPAIPRGAPVYRGGGGIGIGVGVVVPLDEPVYTHDGSVGYDDPMFAGDELYVSMTLVSAYDGRVLWHARDHLDLDADEPQDIERMVHAFLDTLPPAVPVAR